LNLSAFKAASKAHNSSLLTFPGGTAPRQRSVPEIRYRSNIVHLEEAPQIYFQNVLRSRTSSMLGPADIELPVGKIVGLLHDLAIGDPVQGDEK
jgi:hypothetical protein